MKRSSMVLFLIVTLLMSNVSTVSASFSDVEGSWAREAILRLEKSGVFKGIYEGIYQPNSTASREDLIEIAARGFNLSQMEKQTIYTWLDHLIPMDQDMEYNGDMLTRAELIALVANVLGLTDQSLYVNNWFPSFDDVDEEHPVFLPIELINKLGILPTYVMNRFEPGRLSSRAEVAALLDAALKLDTVEGRVASVYPETNRIIIQVEGDEHRSLPVENNTVLLRGGNSISVSQLRTGELIHAFHDKDGLVRIVHVDEVNQNTATILESLSGITQGLSGVVSQQQIIALLSGDLSGINDSLRYNLYEQLLEYGVSPWEAEAFLSQDWQALQDMGKDRIAFALSDYSGVTPELFYAAVNQNWDRALEYAQVEIAQRLLSGMLF